MDYQKVIRATNSVALFCWNHLDGQNYERISREIHGTKCWTYKYKEVIYNHDSRVWPLLLMRYLPEVEAAKLVEYCVKFYNTEL